MFLLPIDSTADGHATSAVGKAGHWNEKSNQLNASERRWLAGALRASPVLLVARLAKLLFAADMAFFF